jgi:Domain of unknown function (DUF4062)
MQLFLSSTFIDLKPERRLLLTALQSPDRHPFGMELFLSEPNTPKAVAERKIQACDAFVLILGFRAGTLVPSDPNNTYTSAEYEHAIALRKPVFVFVKTREGKWRNEEADDQRRQLLAEFHSRVLEKSTAAYFETLIDLELAALRSFTDWEARGIPGARRTFMSQAEWLENKEVSDRLFDFNQTLRGRREDITALDTFDRSANQHIAVLVGKGGMGKTRLLRAWAEIQSQREVLILRDRGVWNSDTYKEVPVGKILLVCDDAHRSDNLDNVLVLLKDLLRAGRDVKCLLSLRPSGYDRVREALSSRFDTNEIEWLKELQELGRSDNKHIAGEVLGKNSQYVDWLVKLSRGNPLVTVIGGRLISRGADLNKLTTSEEFRSAVFDKFLEELGAEDKQVRRLLQLIAAVSPLPANTETFRSGAESFPLLTMRAEEIALELARLERKGLLARTHRSIRIAPDVVSDYLLEEACLDPSHAATGFEKLVFKQFKDSFLSNLLQNLGELDWRLGETTVGANLLRDVWDEISSDFLQADAYGRVQLLRAVQPAAVFQPTAALRLIGFGLSNPVESSPGPAIFEYGQQEVLQAFPPILNSIAMHPDHTEKAVRLLWGLTKNDFRPRSQWPGHAARVLEELASYHMYKPVRFNELILDIIEALVLEKDAFLREFTPLDMLDKLLEREVDLTETSGMAISLSSFPLNYTTVKGLRLRVISLCKALLLGDDPKAAVRSARSLLGILHGFLPKFGRSLQAEELAWQNDERLAVLDIFRETFSDVGVAIRREVLAALRSMISWGRDDSQIVKEATQLFLSLPQNDDLLLLDALLTGDWELDKHGEEWTPATARRQEQIRRAEEILTAQANDVSGQVGKLAALYETTETYGLQTLGGATFVDKLCLRPDFLLAFVSHIFSQDCPPGLSFLMQVALNRARSLDPEFYRTIGVASASHPNPIVARGAAAGLHTIDVRHGIPEDVDVLQSLGGHLDDTVRLNVLGALRFLATDTRFSSKAVDIALSVDLKRNIQLADEFCEIFGIHGVGPAVLSSEQLKCAFRKLIPIGKLDRYNIEHFISWASSAHLETTIDFFLERINLAVKDQKTTDYRPLPSGLSFRLSGPATEVREGQLARLFDLFVQATREQEYLRHHYLRHLFWLLGTSDATTISMFDAVLHSHDKEKFEVLLDLISGDAPGRLAVNWPWFALQVLENAHQLGQELAEKAKSHLVTNAVLGGGFTQLSLRGQNDLPDQPLLDRQQQFSEVPLLRDLFSAISSSLQVHHQQAEGMRLAIQEDFL